LIPSKSVVAFCIDNLRLFQWCICIDRSSDGAMRDFDRCRSPSGKYYELSERFSALVVYKSNVDVFDCVALSGVYFFIAGAV